MSPLPTRFLRFQLERWIQRGLAGQLLIMVALIALVAVLGGLVAWAATPAFESPGAAIWWAFLRLTDPGYLGDDEGTLLRVVSTAVTVLGYVLFMGSLIAIMTQWLARTIRRLESGLTPISMHDHVLVLGWTERTVEIVARLLGARGRLTRFLDRRDVSSLRVVILADAIDAARRLELREALGPEWSESRILLRSGSSQQREDLLRLDPTRAAVVVVPGSDFELGGVELTDARVMKTLLTLEQILAPVPPGERPLVVAEVFDPLKVPLARGIMRGPLEVVTSDGVLSRLIAQSIRHPRLGGVLLELLAHGGASSLYVRAVPELAGTTPAGIVERLPRAVLLGVVRTQDGRPQALLNPPPDTRLERDDLLVLLAATYDDCELDPPGSEGPAVEPAPAPAPHPPAVRKLLVVGWSPKLAALLEELGRSEIERFEVTVASRLPVEQREGSLRHLELDPARVVVTHAEAELTSLHDMTRLQPTRFDHVLFLASARMSTSEEADGRTILGYLLLRSILAESAGDGPELLVELLEPENSRLFPPSNDVLLISSHVISHILAHVALRPELNAVLEALFVTGGTEVHLRRPRDYGLEGRTLRFRELERAVMARREVAVGVLPATPADAAPQRRYGLDPAADREWHLGPDDRLVVLATD